MLEPWWGVGEATVKGGALVELDRPPDLVAIDPGEVHCGVACFHFAGEAASVPPEAVWSAEGTDGAWFVSAAFEVPPWGCLVFVREWVRAVGKAAPGERNGGELVVELFRLYGDLAMVQTGSRMRTAELIGALRYLHATEAGGHLVRWTEQPADILKGTKKILNAKKATSAASKLRAGEHAKAAELHGWHYLLK